LVDHISAQLGSRGDETLEAWGSDPERLSVMVIVCSIIQDEFWWPNARFLPGDPLKLLFRRRNQFCGEVVNVKMAIEHTLGVRFTLKGLDLFAMTVGEFVDFVATEKLRGRELMALST
jgi:hypothetical protein